MHEPITIQVVRLPHGQDLPLPGYQTPHSAGMDLMAAISADEPVELQPLQRFACPCGFAMAIPPGFEAQIRPRSGLALKHGVAPANTPGTIDADYRGQVHVPLMNHGSVPFVIEPGMRIAQMIIAEVPPVELVEVDELDATIRASGGVGATGS